MDKSIDFLLENAGPVIRKTEDGPEKDVPHFFVDLDDIILLFPEHGFDLIRVRHIDDCYWSHAIQKGKHYFILAKKLEKAGIRCGKIA